MTQANNTPTASQRRKYTVGKLGIQRTVKQARDYVLTSAGPKVVAG